ncbi:ribosome small subunit-dependent GTPase A [Alkalibacterium sp. 20]|uniref:ribosome small subunit-dependent GTPase A n=1 Tax=Alkalibacterium sp. 20 TaxID=1798803 RepID=UPI0009000822|nr:ribosome small subunit-dependent GTPase A [Alkalibacterium sp. 20]OJF94173.1 ribosome biogenesis GTPase RsgA [Alkalibacterium sp. 20]
MSEIDMENLGLDAKFVKEATSYINLYIGRVISQSKDVYKVATENVDLLAQISGKFRYDVVDSSDYPAVGDFVMLDRNEDASGNAIIHKVLTRKSAFIRKASGTSHDEQIIAANIDTVFICMSLNKDFNLRRIERYLGITWDSGATPVIVLTKADLCDNLKQKLLKLETVTCGVDVLVTSSVDVDGHSSVQKYFGVGKTVAFLGSSGVGKSTLINKLTGKNTIKTNELRNDDKGRHTTTRREIIILPNGGVVIDTPGMREIGLESANLSRTFSDIDTLAAECKFNDCSHMSEPGCAVKKAIREGELTEERFASYLKLKKEAKYEGLNAKQIETEKLNEMFKEVGGMKKARKFIEKGNRER